MKRLRAWFLMRFLPAWAKESVYRENEELRRRVSELKGEIARLEAYAAGLERGLRRGVTIHNEVGK